MARDKPSFVTLTHPDYQTEIRDWMKFRYVAQGGSSFVDKYLRKLSKREDNNDFNDRKAVSYNPAFAKLAVNEVKNAIFQRMSDIRREGGTKSYQEAVQGKNNGVDLLGSTMDGFIGRKVLFELLVMRKVGVYVDMPERRGDTLADNAGIRPYVYCYEAEDIRSWCNDDSGDPNEFSAVLLREYVNNIDERTKLPNGQRIRYRHIWKEGGAVWVQFYDKEGKSVDQYGSPSDPIRLDLPKIPFVLFEISNSLLEDVADYQIALLNLASSDMGYSLKSNFPFYTEQRDVRSGSPYVRESNVGDTGTEADAEDKSKEAAVGAGAGRAYYKGLERPGFIHPSSEPLQASMAKQAQLKEEIRQLVQLSVTNLKPTRMASAESKQQDEKSLESGLSYIGLELEHGERQIGNIWAMYENQQKSVTVKYPEKYSLKTEDDRRKDAKELREVMVTLPSGTFQKEIGKQIAEIMLGCKVSSEVLEKVKKEIDSAPTMNADPEVVAKDVEVGLVSLDLASKARGYPEGEVKKAQKDHADRLARIAESQASKNEMQNGAARGVADQGSQGEGSKEKAESRDTTQDDKVSDKVRGEGK